MSERAHPLVIGIDIGTSGVRAVAMGDAHELTASASRRLDQMGSSPSDPKVWWLATDAVLRDILGRIEAARVVAISVDGTSGTVVPIDSDGTPLGDALMYNAAVEDEGIVTSLDTLPPQGNAAAGPTSGLAKFLWAQKTFPRSRACHQADWIAGRLCGRYDFSDESNALKTGYDPVNRQWPGWLGETGLDTGRLPDVVPSGTSVAALRGEIAARYGLPAETIVVAGTTDGCASFLAAGADEIGDAVTALGSTLTVKLLSPRPIFAPAFGIYSHRTIRGWLAGGASNSGGKVLERFFTPARLAELSGEIDPAKPADLGYYPLPAIGERFPHADPGMKPRLTPRPESDTAFLAALFEGMAGIEQLAYAKLEEMGAGPLRSIRTVGGGAANPAWTAIRRRRLKVPFLPARSGEAAAGAAILALHGAKAAGLA
jgi:sugar (pentulose or hexulose) kinase